MGGGLLGSGRRGGCIAVGINFFGVQNFKLLINFSEIIQIIMIPGSMRLVFSSSYSTCTAAAAEARGEREGTAETSERDVEVCFTMFDLWLWLIQVLVRQNRHSFGPED